MGEELGGDGVYAAKWKFGTSTGLSAGAGESLVLLESMVLESSWLESWGLLVGMC